MLLTREQQQELSNFVFNSIEKYFIENKEFISNNANVVVKQISNQIDEQWKKYETKINFLYEDYEKLESKVDNLEQLNKKNNIRIIGLNNMTFSK